MFQVKCDIIEGDIKEVWVYYPEANYVKLPGTMNNMDLAVSIYTRWDFSQWARIMCQPAGRNEDNVQITSQ
jgi:hypothetical protein